MKSGIRKCVYIPAEKKWVINAIGSVITEGEKLGVFLSASDIIVQALEEFLVKYKECTPPKKIKTYKMGLAKRSIKVPEKMRWLFQRIEMLVELKKQAGLKSSFSRELCSLAAASLTQDKNYGIMCGNLLANAAKRKL